MFSLAALIRPDALRVCVAEVERFTTVNRTICSDQIPASAIARIDEWQPLLEFLAAAMDKRRLYPIRPR